MPAVLDCTSGVLDWVSVVLDVEREIALCNQRCMCVRAEDNGRGVPFVSLLSLNVANTFLSGDGG